MFPILERLFGWNEENEGLDLSFLPPRLSPEDLSFSCQGVSERSVEELWAVSETDPAITDPLPSDFQAIQGNECRSLWHTPRPGRDQDRQGSEHVVTAYLLI